MMKKKLLFIAMLAIAPLFTNAQDEITHTRKLEHSVGVQVNELIRQVFNFNNTGNTNNNPYLLTYSLNLAKSGWGIRVGGGYTTRSFANDNGVNATNSNIDVIHARFGIEKKFQLAEKWSTGVGIDGVYDNDKNNTESVVRGFDTTTTKTKSLITSYGGGVMGWLRYNVTPKIQVGTEASFYYRTGFQKEQVDITKRNNQIQSRPIVTTSAKIDNDLKAGSFNVPVAFYLLIRF